MLPPKLTNEALAEVVNLGGGCQLLALPHVLGTFKGPLKDVNACEEEYGAIA